MRYDAANHLDSEKFITWANGGICPYESEKYQRVANFTEHRKLYSPGPAKSALDLMIACIREHCKNSDYCD
jgi:hypothetical protein